MAETEIVDHMLPTEKYVPLRTTAAAQLPASSSLMPSRWMAKREVAIAACAISFLYMINGTYAGTMCNILTSVPVAVFTYNVLISKKSTQAGYNAILFYWSIYGISTLFDALFYESYGYFVLKFSLLMAVFAHAAHKNDRVFQQLFGTQPAAVADYLSTMASTHDAEGFPMDSPAATAFSEDDDEAGSSVFMPSTAATACQIHDAALPERNLLAQMFSSVAPCPVHYSDEDDSMQTTQPNTTIRSEKSHRPSRTCHGIDRVLTPCAEAIKHDFGPRFCESAQTAQPMRMAAGYNESSCTVGTAYGDLITNPMDKIVFSKPNESRNIRVSNVSSQNIMWALKCNALHRLGASPACGVIPVGGTIDIRMVLHDGVVVDGAAAGDEAMDKLAIDYALVGRQKDYCVSFVGRQDKKRHLLRIGYHM